jgi:hypothetical protein
MEPWCTVVPSTRLMRLGDRPGLEGSRCGRADSTLRSSNVMRDVDGTGARRMGVRADTSRALPSICQAARGVRRCLPYRTHCVHATHAGDTCGRRPGRCGHGRVRRWSHVAQRTCASMASFLAAARRGDNEANGSYSTAF